ncbi:PREDICTED: nuclear distribution protein nudF 1-like [Amphimedon queenslandica]|uniref:Anaphase-promoting complex subunit 4 WD40 domain-containing protein n=1 Tax=Amphimedon queenslandica TaxID=400682 RepID=A0AAN0J269_AMPQE|nr:PREDICTED: nuclear distribution protein nudF 1-like [Amphimedon queenslandica]|eukprot:XP_019851105.1 PREDICTED: nuclear distribution protein nudF 1-like [Amphimedon queenslandica]
MDARVMSFKLNCSSPVTAFTYHPLRREIVTGHEDGLIKTWDADTGKSTLSLKKHEGMITDLLYWATGRLLISSSLDGSIIQWAPSGAINGANDIGQAIYSMCWYQKLNGLVVGCLCNLSVLLPSGQYGTLGLPLLTKGGYTISSHTDIIRCIETDGNKVFSAGYDKRLCVYDVSGLHSAHTPELHLVYTKERAHDAAVTCLWVDSETDWVFTGSFDKQVKIWSSDIKQLHSLQFLDTITGVSFVSETKVLWVSTEGSNTPFHFEPKSGDKITDYLDPAAHSMRTGANSIRWQSFIQHMNIAHMKANAIQSISSEPCFFSSDVFIGYTMPALNMHTRTVV